MSTYYSCKQCGWAGEVSGRPRCLACYQRRTTEWRRRNPGKARQQNERWLARRLARDPDYEARRKRIRRARNTNTARAAWRRRIDWLTAGDVTREHLRAIYRRDGGRCVYCKAPVKARFSPNDPRGFDHILSRFAGGKHTPSNIVVACRGCNERKG